MTFIGISDETEDKVKPFVDKMGEKMDYVVAVDDTRKTFKAYMEAYSQNGIPTSFVVNKEGQIVWVGHPMGGLDEAITQVVAGKFDVAAAQKEFSEREVSQKRMMELNTLFGAYLQQSDKGEKEKAAETGAKLLEIASKDQMILNAIAWNVLTNPRLKNRDLAFALKASEAAVAVSGGKDGAILDTYARALFDNGKVTEAVATQKKAVGLVTDKTQKAELEKTLQKYETAPAK